MADITDKWDSMALAMAISGSTFTPAGSLA